MARRTATRVGGRMLNRMRRLLPFAFTVAATPAVASDWPLRPLKLGVSGAPGSPPDLVARLLASRLGPDLGQPVVVDNRPGPGGLLAMEFLVHSPADGHTIALASMSQAVFNSHLFARLPYDPLRDLQPIGTLVTAGMAVAVHPTVP